MEPYNWKAVAGVLLIALVLILAMSLWGEPGLIPYPGRIA